MNMDSFEETQVILCLLLLKKNDCSEHFLMYLFRKGVISWWRENKKW